MTDSVLIDIEKLRVGMFIQLSVNWIRHPFATSSFRITTPEQIRMLRDSGILSVRYIPSKSTLAEDFQQQAAQTDDVPGDQKRQPSPPAGQDEALSEERDPIEQRVASMRHCMKRHREAALAYDRLAAGSVHQPQHAREQADDLVHSCVQELLGREPCAIRLLACRAEEGAAAHAVNVMILALLLARALGQDAPGLQRVGLAALLHDIGKVEMPLHIAQPGAPLAPADLHRYQAHVGESVAMGQRMGLPSDVLIAIAHHHEFADGSGYPLRLVAEDLTCEGQILALVNRYDRLCNPLQGQAALTPHEAVSQLYSQQRSCFDSAVLGAFIRMMGVYPPGSLVQLVDGRYALVIRVEPSYPLRPWVQVYDEEAPGLELDLALHPQLGIHRSLRPSQLPPQVLQALVPQERICYYFERTTNHPDVEGPE
ncbi:HD-GYP domain-containing protein [Pulveribacter suum]|uniref:Phosphohydrolase n=1 Tax=Pulveribacter suum TaxID=2116657 RepID=A0A2P1NPR6_9BURK|nr:HD-GYP domain-containing protein [Pulveribacter suum]AVP59048.1 phosphohydrolase [Pulveribacter suum]